MKSKAWSIIGLILSIGCFVAGIVAFIVAAVLGKEDITPVATGSYVASITGLVLGIVSVWCCGKRTSFNARTKAGFANLAKVGLMVCIIVFFATVGNVAA